MGKKRGCYGLHVGYPTPQDHHVVDKKDREITAAVRSAVPWVKEIPDSGFSSTGVRDLQFDSISFNGRCMTRAEAARAAAAARRVSKVKANVKRGKAVPMFFDD